MRNFWFALLFAAACGPSVGAGGTDVGAACTTNSQCASMCFTSDHYPGGMCTFTCASDLNCVKGTTCVGDRNGNGICAVGCGQPADCAAFGRGFTCDATDRVGAPGQALVCRVP